jgi:hypothetical protein
MEENTSTLDIRAIKKIERESAFIDLLTMEMNKVIGPKAHDRKIIDWTSWPRTYFARRCSGLAKH